MVSQGTSLRSGTFFADAPLIGQLPNYLNWIIQNFSKLSQDAEMVWTGTKLKGMKFLILGRNLEKQALKS